MNVLQHAYEATFEELLQLAYALKRPGEFVTTITGSIRQREPMVSYRARSCPLCATFNELFDIRGAQYPAQQLIRQVQRDGLSPWDFRFWGTVQLSQAGPTAAAGWAQFIAAADNTDKSEEGQARNQLMQEVLCTS